MLASTVGEMIAKLLYNHSARYWGGQKWKGTALAVNIRHSF